MHLSVALPSFVLDKKNHMPILVIFLLMIVVVFPVSVWIWYNSVTSVESNGMPVINNRIYFDLVNENLLKKQIPFILAVSAEFSRIDTKEDEVEDLTKV